MGRYFFVRHQAMFKAFEEGDEEKAYQDAEELLLDSELPILYRVRCHMLLGTDDSNAFYVQHANEAVRLLDEDCRDQVDPEGFPQIQYDEALRLQKLAVEEAEARAAAESEEEEEEDVEEEVEEDDEMDVDEEQAVQGPGDAEGDEKATEGVEIEGRAQPPPVSRANQLLLREAVGMGSTSKHGLITPNTSRTASNRTESFPRGASRRSSRLAGQPLTPLKESQQGEDEGTGEGEGGGEGEDGEN